MLTILSVQFISIKYFHIVIQSSPPSISRTLFISLNRNSIPIKTPFLPSPATGNHRSTFCFYESDYSGTSYKWNHTVLVFLCLAYFTWHDAFKAHPCCGKCQTFPFSRLNNIPLCYTVPHFTYTVPYFTEHWLHSPFGYCE